MSVTGSNIIGEDRRERYRALMARFNPTVSPALAIESGLVVTDSQRSVFETLAARADIEPGSQQILVGGIGSGKTTELLLARQWLAATGRYRPFQIDVSSYTDLSKLTSGALLASLGIHLLDEGRLRGAQNYSEIETALNTFAYGRERTQVVYDS